MASDGIGGLGGLGAFGHGVASYEGSPCPNLLQPLPESNP